jgi:hypothetical protein
LWCLEVLQAVSMIASTSPRIVVASCRSTGWSRPTPSRAATAAWWARVSFSLLGTQHATLPRTVRSPCRSW